VFFDGIAAEDATKDELCAPSTPTKSVSEPPTPGTAEKPRRRPLFVQDLGPPKRLLVIGEVGDGKSTLINNLRDPLASEEALAGKKARGVTKELVEYKGKPICGYDTVFIDTPGIGDADVPIQKLLVMLEKKLAGSEAMLDGVIVTTPVSDARFKLGAQVVKFLVSSGFVGGDEKWENIILAGTKDDKADEGDRACFVDDVAKEMFADAPKRRETGCVRVSHTDYSQLTKAISEFPNLKISYEMPSDEVVIKELLPKVGGDCELWRGMQEARDEARHEFEMLAVQFKEEQANAEKDRAEARRVSAAMAAQTKVDRASADAAMQATMVSLFRAETAESEQPFQEQARREEQAEAECQRRAEKEGTGRSLQEQARLKEQARREAQAEAERRRRAEKEEAGRLARLQEEARLQEQARLQKARREAQANLERRRSAEKEQAAYEKALLREEARCREEARQAQAEAARQEEARLQEQARLQEARREAQANLERRRSAEKEQAAYKKALLREEARRREEARQAQAEAARRRREEEERNNARFREEARYHEQARRAQETTYEPSYPSTPQASYGDSVGTYSSNGSANGRTLYQGPRGGTYYLTASGNKKYV